LTIEKSQHDLKSGENSFDSTDPDCLNSEGDEVMLENNLSGVDITNICEVTASRIGVLNTMIELSRIKITENPIQTSTKISAARKEKVFVTSFIGNLCKLGNHDVDKAIVNMGILPKILEFVSLFP